MKTALFTSSDSDGPATCRVDVLGRLPESEADRKLGPTFRQLDDGRLVRVNGASRLAPMYRVRLPDGTLTDAFADELAETA